MATKPTFSPPQFGLGDGAGNYTSGSRTGDPSRIAIPDVTNGYTPGVVIEPESFNYYVGDIILDWQTNWLALGSALAGLDAHIIEADSTGHAQIASANFGGTSYVDTLIGAAVFIQNNTGAAGTKGLLVSTDTGTAIEAGNSSSTQPAFYAFNDFSGGGLVAQYQALDGGKIAEFESFNDPTDGVSIQGLGTGKYGLLVEAADDGNAILILDRLGAGTPVRGAISLPERARASAPLNGDLWKTPGVATFSRGFLEWEDDGGTAALGKGTQRAWSSVGGLGYAHAETLGDTTESAASFALAVTITMDGSTATEPDGDYIVEWAAFTRPNNGGIPISEVNVTGPGGFTETVHMVSPLNGVRVPFSFKKKFTFSGGPDTWTMSIQTSTGTQEVIMDEASITIRGAYE